uniref:Uncharacterized protein n=1 Tax=Manihot esculenta TaxID=3983 RepID=A0A2C9V0R7_MANES
MLDIFKPLLAEGDVYYISSFVMLPSQRNYKLSQHHFRIKLMRNAFIKKIDSVEPIIPFDRFAFLEFEEISKVYDNDIFFIDLMYYLAYQ